MSYPGTVRPGSKTSVKSNKAMMGQVKKEEYKLEDSGGKRRNFRGKHKSLAAPKDTLENDEYSPSKKQNYDNYEI
jgi:hypothetical protein